MTPDEMLFELIKFDMEQIRHYGDAILNISSISVVAAFAISAFVYNKRTTKISEVTILTSSHIFILFILLISMFYYFEGIDGSRLTLEMRECALKAKIEKGQEIGTKELYPQINPKTVPSCNTDSKLHMDSHLEKYPIFLAIVLIFLKWVAEIWLIPKRRIKANDGSAN